jgi:hypothetical protein
MLRKILIGLVVLLLAAVVLLYIFGRGRVAERGAGLPAVNRLGEEARLESVRLYFGDPARFGLRAEERTLVAGPSLTDRLDVCIRELAAGSLTGGAPVIPSDTRLLNAFVDPWGLVFLDFNRALQGAQSPGDGEEWLAIASIVRTVCDNYPEIRQVRFMVEGQVVTSLAGYVDLEENLDGEAFPLTPAGP